MAEGNDVLRFAIFEDGERGLVEVGNEVLLVVDNSGVKKDFVDILADDEGSIFVNRLLRIWRLS